MSLNLFRKFAALATLALVLFAAGSASAHLIISPQRFVFEDRVRSQTIMLLNDDTAAHTYRLTWKMMKMDEQGVYHDMPLDSSDAHSVPQMVVYSPRQVTLGPGVRQTVRMSLRAPADLPKGEYRAHLSFEQVPDEPAPATGDKKSEGQNIQLKVTVSVTVPVIVRAGDMDAGDVSIAEPRLKANNNRPPSLALDLVHTPGQSSAYGVIKVKIGSSEQIGLLSNVALYPEQSKRSVLVPLTKPIPPGTPITVTFEGDGEYKGRTFVQQQVNPS